VAISILTFALGIGASLLWREYTYRAQPRVFSNTTSGLPLQLLYVDACGGATNTQTFAMPNGGQISVSCLYFSSEEAANGLFHDITPETANVIEWSENFDSKGNSIGKTIVLAGPTVLRLSTYGKALCRTRASSLEDLRTFENPAR
jgi:hypothetical protein